MLTNKEDRGTGGGYARHNGLIHSDENLNKAREWLMNPHSNLSKAFSRSILTTMEPFLVFKVDMVWTISWNDDVITSFSAGDEAGLKGVG